MSVSSDRARWVISLLIVRMTGDHGILGAFDQMTSGNLSSAEHRITSRESDDRLIKLNLYSFFSLVTVDTFKAPGSLR